MKNFRWFVGGVLLTCLLGAANAKFKTVMCEGVSADKFLAIGDGVNLGVDGVSSSLTLVSPDGKTTLILVCGNNKAIMQVTGPAGKKLDILYP